MGKVILIVLVFFISVLIGYVFGEIYRKRPIDLKECYKGINSLKNEVIFNMTPLPYAIEKVSESMKYPYKNILEESSSDLINGNINSVLDGLSNRYINYEKDIYLKNEDKKIIENFIRQIENAGVYGIENIFKMCLESLNNNIKEAEEISKKNTKMYRYLGVCIGLMLAILII